MLQHWAALCQPIHARLAHFAPSIRSQFPLRWATSPYRRTDTAPFAWFAGVYA
jgi:hypothetical protein